VRLRHSLVVLFVAVPILAAGSRLARAGGGFIPPMRLDVSPSSTLLGDGPHVGMHVLAGLHWASLSPRWNNNLDLGIGYVYDGFTDDGAPTAPDGAILAAGPTAPRDTPRTAAHGLYLEADHRTGGTHHRRSWLGLRAELLFGSVGGETRTGAALVGRAAWELFTPIKASGCNGGALGMFGVGVYLEAGARLLPDGRAGIMTTAGVSMRLPAIAAGS